MTIVCGVGCGTATSGRFLRFFGTCKGDSVTLCVDITCRCMDKGLVLLLLLLVLVLLLLLLLLDRGQR